MLRCDGDLDDGYVAMVSLLRWGFWLRCCFCFAGGFVALVILARWLFCCAGDSVVLVVFSCAGDFVVLHGV